MARSTFSHNLCTLRKTDKHQTLKERILEIYHHHKGRYGYRRITLALRRGGCPINHKTVQRLMGELSLRAVIRVRKYRSCKGQVEKIAPNRLQRDLTASSTNEKCVSDVTEFDVNGKKLYLYPAIDAFNSEVIAYSLSERPVMALVIRCWIKHLRSCLQSAAERPQLGRIPVAAEAGSMECYDHL